MSDRAGHAMEESELDPLYYLPQCMSAGFRDGVLQLLAAADYARDARVEVWEFAIELEELRRTGFTVSDLRWLMSKGHVSHGIETTEPRDNQREIRIQAGFAIQKRTAVVLTAQGVVFARALLAQSSPTMVEFPEETSAGTHHPQDSPVWDSSKRELRLNGTLIKCFRVPARNQELVLDSFQEEGWPPCVLDPLPRNNSVVPEKRLQNTIKRLNGKHLNRSVISFHGNGNGNGVCWKRHAQQTRVIAESRCAPECT